MSTDPLYPASLWYGLDDGMSRLIFKFQTGVLETKDLDGQYSTELRLIFVFFFRLFAQPIAGHIQKIKYRNNCRGNQQFFVFHFSIFVVHRSGWPY